MEGGAQEGGREWKEEGREGGKEGGKREGKERGGGEERDGGREGGVEERGRVEVCTERGKDGSGVRREKTYLFFLNTAVVRVKWELLNS